jgi:hypothetical protein
VRRELAVVGLLAFMSFTIVACTTLEGEDDVDHFAGYNKGCLSGGCDYRPPDAAPPRAEVLPEGCPQGRSDPALGGMSIADVRALLPGRYRVCSEYYDSLEIILTEAGQLVADGEPLIIGACGKTRCDVQWGPQPGSLQLWADPPAFSFTSGAVVDGFVRLDD